jgi:hypothetical protein
VIIDLGASLLLGIRECVDDVNGIDSSNDCFNICHDRIPQYEKVD